MRHIEEKTKLIKLTGFNKVVGADIVTRDLFIKDGIICLESDVNDLSNCLTLDLNDCVIAPGFIDPQVNGLGSCSFWSDPMPSFNEIDELRKELAFSGVVSFCPTIITASVEKITKAIDYINAYIKQTQAAPGARILGLHIEGVFITKYGVHNPTYVQKDLTIENLKPFVKPNVVIFTLAPELDKTGEAIKFLQGNNILVSIGHSNATYREGKAAIKNYNLHTVTHMFNSLRGVEGFSHRGNNLNLEILRSKLQDKSKINPDSDGIMLAVLEDKEVLCMVISDGVHVSPSVIRLLKEFKDNDHFVLVSDLVSKDFYDTESLKGMLGGGQHTVSNCISNLINWKLSNIEDSLLFASRPLSKQLKTAQKAGLGHIEFGKEANIVLWDTTKNVVKGTIIGENVFFNY